MDFETLIDPRSAQQDPQLEIADPTTGLTKRQRLLVQTTWADVCLLGKSTVAIELFDLFFRRNPTYTENFAALKDIPIDQLKTHPRLKAHGAAVVHAISSVVENLDDPATVVLILTKTGRDHVKRNIKPEQFYELKTTILILLEKVLKKKFHPIVKESWDQALNVVMKVVTGALLEHQAETNK